MLCLGPDAQSFFMVKTGSAPLTTVMRRLLTGYAAGFLNDDTNGTAVYSRIAINRFFVRKIVI
jgi:hypothetical protein